ncbi:MAG: efflux RND transporter permease subunit [Propionibacteriaceae bacterium]|jgi:HAE1 family hydrophobic/amphiphilic exporter-1|nr:efflux RND transporter permease subunit [Propionibacteriaceae bacterium]
MIKSLVRKPYLVLVGVVLVFALGITSFTSMTPELLPNLDLPYVIAVTSYPGASPENVEAEITRPMEESFATIDGMQTLTSRSNENYSMLIMEFSDGVSMDTAMLDLSQKIEQVSYGWNEMIGTPVLMKINPNMLPVMVAAVEKEGADATELSTFVKDNLETRLEGITGVASLNVTGIIEEQVNVVIRQDKLDALDETVEQAINDKIDEQKDELRDTQADLEDKLDDVESGEQQLTNGANQLAKGMGKGATQLATGTTALTTTSADLKAQLADLQAKRPDIVSQRDTLQKQRDELASQISAMTTAKAQIEEALPTAQAGLAALGQAKAACDAGTPPPGVDCSTIDTQIATLTAQIAEMQTNLDTINANLPTAKSGLKQLDDGLAKIKKGLKQLDSGVKKLKAGIKTVEENQTKLAKGQGTMTEQLASNLYKLADGSAQLQAGKATLNLALTQVDQGLDQIKEARKTALKQANVGAQLTMETVSGLLTAQNFSMPAGYVHQEFQDYLVRVGDEVGSLEELQNMVLMDPGIEGVDPIRLSDVADVFMSDNLETAYTNINGHDGVLITFTKQSQHATTDVTNAISAKFAELQQTYDGLRFIELMNQGDYIYMVISALGSDLIWGAVFAIVILLIFLRDFRPTLITLCSIPISLVAALVAMYFSGVTLNVLSIGGLAIAVGRLVDDSVVVMENIFRLRSLGYSATRAAVAGAKQVAGAVAASTLTTVCVFVPIVFVTGLTRQLFTDFALTFAYALLASLAVSVTLVPVVASGVFRKMEPKEHKWFDAMLRGYDKLLLLALRFKWAVLALAVALLAGSAALVWGNGFAYMPNVSTGEMSITLEMPDETTTSERKEIANEAVARIQAIDGVLEVGAMPYGSAMSGSGMGALAGLAGGDDLSTIAVYALAEESLDAEQLTADVEAALADLNTTASVGDSSMSSTFLGTGGITVNLYSNDIEAMMDGAELVSQAVESIDGIAEVDDGLEDAEPVLHFTIDRDKAAEKALTTAQAYQLVQAALTESKTATDVSFNGDTLDVLVVNQYFEDDTLTPDHIKELVLNVTQRDGTVEEVKLADISTFSEDETLPMIQREDQRRVLPITITIDEDSNITLVTNDVEQAIAGLQLPEDVTYEISGENSTIMDSFTQLGLMMLLGLLLVYLIMVGQFQSLLSPFIIMFTVPLAFTGGLLALLITGKVLSVISMIGFAMLLGVIVSNGIVLIDYINRLRREGADRLTAIREGTATRMRPILMTALATVFALLVMALGIREGSGMMQPMAIVCVGGLLYGTLMTLFVVPIVYDLLVRKDPKVVADSEFEAVTD